MQAKTAGRRKLEQIFLKNVFVLLIEEWVDLNLNHDLDLSLRSSNSANCKKSTIRIMIKIKIKIYSSL